MLRLHAFRVEQKEDGDASLSAADSAVLGAISEFGAKPYTEDERKELSELVKSFNDRHGTAFSEADMLRFEQVNREIVDEDLTEMLRNNPPDVVYSAFSQAFFRVRSACFSATMRCETLCFRIPRSVPPPRDTFSIAHSGRLALARAGRLTPLMLLSVDSSGREMKFAAAQFDCMGLPPCRFLYHSPIFRKNAKIGLPVGYGSSLGHAQWC